jgi:hypothetical protein
MIGGAWTRIIREFSAVSLVKRLFTNSEFTKGGRFLDHILRVIHKTKLHLFYTQIFFMPSSFSASDELASSATTTARGGGAGSAQEGGINFPGIGNSGRAHERGQALHPSRGGKIFNTDACP